MNSWNWGSMEETVLRPLNRRRLKKPHHSSLFLFLAKAALFPDTCGGRFTLIFPNSRAARTVAAR